MRCALRFYTLSIVFALLICEMAFGHGGQFTGPVTPTALGGSGDLTLAPNTLEGCPNWEQWWARNRFAYLNFPDIIELESKARPITPKKTAEKHTADQLDFLKQESIELFRALLKSGALTVKGAAAMGLSRLQDTQSAPDIFELLKQPNQAVKNAVPEAFTHFAQVALAMNKAAGVRSMLNEQALDKDLPINTRVIALQGLGLMGEEQDAKFLVDFIFPQKGFFRMDPKLMGAAVNALSRCSAPFVYPIFYDLLTTPCTEARRSAALGMGIQAKSRDPKAVKKLRRLYRNTQDIVLKCFCLISIGQIGGDEALTQLIQSVKHSNKMIRPWACLGLGLALRKDTNPLAEKALLQKLSNKEGKNAAAVALGLARSKKAVAPLIKLLREDQDGFLRGYCALGLGLINDSRALNPLRATLKNDAFAGARLQAAMALTNMNDWSSASALSELFFRKTNPSEKACLAQSLCYMVDLECVKSTLTRLKILSQPLDPASQSLCIRVISQCLSRRTTPFLTPLAMDSNVMDKPGVFATLFAMDL